MRKNQSVDGARRPDGEALTLGPLFERLAGHVLELRWRHLVLGEKVAERLVFDRTLLRAPKFLLIDF